MDKTDDIVVPFHDEIIAFLTDNGTAVDHDLNDQIKTVLVECDGDKNKLITSLIHSYFPSSGASSSSTTSFYQEIASVILYQYFKNAYLNTSNLIDMASNIIPKLNKGDQVDIEAISDILQENQVNGNVFVKGTTEYMNGAKFSELFKPLNNWEDSKGVFSTFWREMNRWEPFEERPELKSKSDRHRDEQMLIGILQDDEKTNVKMLVKEQNENDPITTKRTVTTVWNSFSKQQERFAKLEQFQKSQLFDKELMQCIDARNTHSTSSWCPEIELFDRATFTFICAAMIVDLSNLCMIYLWWNQGFRFSGKPIPHEIPPWNQLSFSFLVMSVSFSILCIFPILMRGRSCNTFMGNLKLYLSCFSLSNYFEFEIWHFWFCGVPLLAMAVILDVAAIVIPIVVPMFFHCFLAFLALVFGPSWLRGPQRWSQRIPYKYTRVLSRFIKNDELSGERLRYLCYNIVPCDHVENNDNYNVFRSVRYRYALTSEYHPLWFLGRPNTGRRISWVPFESFLYGEYCKLNVWEILWLFVFGLLILCPICGYIVVMSRYEMASSLDWLQHLVISVYIVSVMVMLYAIPKAYYLVYFVSHLHHWNRDAERLVWNAPIRILLAGLPKGVAVILWSYLGEETSWREDIPVVI